MTIQTYRQGEGVTPKYEKLREEEIKNKVAMDYFSEYDHTQIVGNIDFCIAAKDKTEYTVFLFEELKMPSLLWAEAKKGVVKDINESFVQLILTIGKARTFDENIPPNFIGAFDAEKIAFLPYHKIQYVFNQNDFNWNVPPSNHGTKEFLQLYTLVKDILTSQTLLFYFSENDSELKKFIKLNFKTGIDTLAKIKVNKNNFTFIYQKWCKTVMPTISVDWNIAKKAGLIDADFFLADLLSKENKTLKEKLFVLLQDNRYILDRKIDDTGFETSKQATFKDDQKAHNLFWNLYERPPKKEYWNYIIERRDLLVPQDVRERKGSFFTPQQWVELSQKYIADVLGDDWQDEYYVWDCCAGTGNLLNGLTNKRNIFASTLDKADVDVIKDRINNGACLFDDHVFQFDFLNDDFIPISKGGKLPDKLFSIINDEEEQKKLVIYINPPYCEAGNKRQTAGTGKNKEDLSKTKIADTYSNFLGKCKNELFAQFHIRIKKEIPSCILGSFSTLIFFSGINFNKYRQFFNASLKNGFVVPANTFDNVKGDFPIGFFIWDLSKFRTEKTIKLNFISSGNKVIEDKIFSFFTDEDKTINQWISSFKTSKDEKDYGILMYDSSDFQANDKVLLTNKCYTGHHHYSKISVKNIIPYFVFFSVRKCIEHSWMNHNYQFMFPCDTWDNDKNFISDSIMFTLFNAKNNISISNGTNHFIPFTEDQVGINRSFESHFMSDFINGKIEINKNELDLFSEKNNSEQEKMQFSTEAQAVYDTGLKLWRYYHTKQDTNVNASFYDIREYFQGRNSKGKMNPDSNDEYYTELIKDLRDKMKILAKKIESKVYEYGFLK